MNKQDADKPFIEALKFWAAAHFRPQGSNDPAIFHGLFTTSDNALQALGVADHLKNGAKLSRTKDAITVMYGDEGVAQAFVVHVNENVTIDL